MSFLLKTRYICNYIEIYFAKEKLPLFYVAPLTTKLPVKEISRSVLEYIIFVNVGIPQTEKECLKRHF